MKTTLENLPVTIHEMLNSRGWDLFTGSKFGSDFFINDPERAARCHDAAEHGCDGSTHAEHIEDWREYVEQLKDEAEREAWRLDDDTASEAAMESVQAWHDTISAEIDACEAWHEANGSLHEEIG